MLSGTKILHEITKVETLKLSFYASSTKVHVVLKYISMISIPRRSADT